MPKVKEAEDPLQSVQNEIESNSQSRQRIKNEECIFSVEAVDEELTLMEELMLVSLGGATNESSSLFSSLTDNLPSVLRASILIELALKQRIALRLDVPESSYLHLESSAPTGNQFLDEALQIIQLHQSSNFSLQKWIDLLTGEIVWDRHLAGCQMLQLRDRLCKCLEEKRVVESVVYRSLLVVEQVSYPVKNVQLHRDLCFRLIDAASGKIPLQLRDLLCLLAVKAAGHLPSLLTVGDAPTRSAVKLSCKRLQERFMQPSQLQQLAPQLPLPQLHLLTGIIEYFSRINSLF